MRWQEFERACPEIAAMARDRFAKDELTMLGTIRPDGSPRISPCEIDFAAGDLLQGMMWQSLKAVDLLRDQRCVVHSVTCDRMGTDGDIKLYGRMIDVRDPGVRGAYRDAIRARIDWAPDEPNFHLFALDVRGAGFISFGRGNEHCMAWDPEGGFRQVRHPDA